MTIFEFLDVKFHSLVVWLADSVHANVEGDHQQVMVIIVVSS